MKNGLIYFTVLVMGLLPVITACTEQEESYIESLPFTSIKVKVEGETVEAQFLDEKTLALEYENVENFSSAEIIADLNPGYEMIFPSDMSNFDLSTYPVVNFRAPDNRIIKYWFTITSRAFPIVDEAKIGVNALGQGKVTVQNSTREVIVYFDKSSMDMRDIRLFFDEGALMPGAEVEQGVAYDFTRGISQELRIKYGELDRIYNVVLNLSSVMEDPRKYGFINISENAVEGEMASFIQLFHAASVMSVPVENSAPETPWSWDVPAYMIDEYMAYIGDWKANRPTKTVNGANFTYLTIDIAKANVSVITNENRSVVVNGSEGYIAMSGISIEDATMIYHNGGVIHNRTSDDAPWRSAIGVTEDGKIMFSNAAINGNSVVKLPFNTTFPGADYIGSGEPWNVRSAIFGKPWLVRDGYLMTREDMYRNDGTGWEIGLGEAWNGVERSRSFIGITYDNKIGIAVIEDRMSIPQAAWVLHKLGWKDVFFIGGSYWLDNSFQPVIYLNGNRVAGNEGQVSQYCIAIDVKH